MQRNRLIALAGASVGVAAGLAAERIAVRRRRARDPDADEPFGRRRGERTGWVELDDGARLFVEEVGPRSERGAVFVHGSVLRTDEWYYQLAGIGGHRLVFYDLRGHGLSQPKGERRFCMETLADDLLAVIEHSGLQEVVIVGHSVGGMIALQLCRQRHDLVGTTIKGLVLANTTHRPAAETILGGAAVARLERTVRRPLDALATQAGRIDAVRKLVRPSDALFWAVAVAAFGPRASAKQIDFTYDMLADTPTDVIFDLIRSYREFQFTEYVGDVMVPVLVIAGSHDRLTVPEASRYLADHLPKAEFQLLEGCGHMSMLERHEQFDAMLETFFDDVLGRPAEASEAGERQP